MPKDPIGILGRMNAASLMMITPEFFKVRRLRTKGAAKISETPARFAMKPERMTLDGVDIRFARAGNPNGPTVLFLSPLPQSILCYAMIRFGTLLRLTLIWSLSICRDLAAAQVT